VDAATAERMKLTTVQKCMLLQPRTEIRRRKQEKPQKMIARTMHVFYVITLGTGQKIVHLKEGRETGTQTDPDPTLEMGLETKMVKDEDQGKDLKPLSTGVEVTPGDQGIPDPDLGIVLDPDHPQTRDLIGQIVQLIDLDRILEDVTNTEVHEKTSTYS